MSELSNPRLSWRGRLSARLQALATYDVFPHFSARVRRAFYNPLGILLLASLAALLCGLFLHPQGFVLAGGALAVIVLGIAWPWLSLRGLRGSISFDRARASEGDLVEARLTLCNRLLCSAWGLAVKYGPARDDREKDTVASIPAAPPRTTARCRWPFVPACRGVYPLVTPCLTTAFPFGLWENRRHLTVDSSLLVWPQTFPVGPVPLVSGDQQVEGNVSRNKVGSNGDVLGVRPYRRGDSPRRIHWGQTARHDRLIVCELQSNARPIIQLVLDDSPHVHSGEGPSSSREWAIRIAASFARGWLEAGAMVGAVWHGQVIPSSSGQQQLHRLLDGLARLPDGPGPALEKVLAMPACRGPQEGLQVIVTTDVSLAEGRAFRPGRDQQRWVVLRAAAFSATLSPSAPPVSLPVRPWLWIDGPQAVPGLLRGCWKEAQHGS
jgi:uncharacterized protein (DUF58 family)